jgi:hypothetical protein
MSGSQTDKLKARWLGTPWTFFVLGMLTWPLYAAVLWLCARFRLSVWIVNVSGVILIFAGIIFAAATWHAAWYCTPRRRLFILVGSIAAWFATGRLIAFWFGHLIHDVSR